MVLDVYGGVNSGVHIIQFPEHGQGNQTWAMTSDGCIQLQDHNLCLTVDSEKKGELFYVMSAPKNGGKNQKWKLVTEYC